MLTKKITYTDYNGVERTEEFHFNLSKAEIMSMEMSVEGGMSSLLQNAIQSMDQTKLFNAFKDLVLKSYGIKSADGKRFIKNDEIREEFEQSEPFSIIFMELMTDEKAASDFVNAIIPKDLAAKVQASTASGAITTSDANTMN